MAKLTGAQKRDLRDGLLDAFTDLDSFDAFLDLDLDRNRAAITTASGLETIILAIIGRAESEGWTLDLLQAAARACGPISFHCKQPYSRSSSTSNNLNPRVMTLLTEQPTATQTLDDLRNVSASAYDDLPRAREIVERAGIPRNVQPITSLTCAAGGGRLFVRRTAAGNATPAVDAAIADPTVVARTATFESLREPVSKLQAQPALLRSGQTAGPDDTADLIRQIDLLLDDTYTAARALDRLGRDSSVISWPAM